MHTCRGMPLKIRVSSLQAAGSDGAGGEYPPLLQAASPQAQVRARVCWAGGSDDVELYDRYADKVKFLSIVVGIVDSVGLGQVRAWVCCGGGAVLYGKTETIWSETALDFVFGIVA